MHDLDGIPVTAQLVPTERSIHSETKAAGGDRGAASRTRDFEQSDTSAGRSLDDANVIQQRGSAPALMLKDRTEFVETYLCAPCRTGASKAIWIQMRRQIRCLLTRP